MPVVDFDKSVVTAMIAEAIEFCVAKMGFFDRSEVEQAICAGECSVCEYLYHGLARALGEYLGSLDDTVRAVYVFNPEYGTVADEPIPDRPRASPGINLIAWVSRKSAALSSVVELLCEAVEEGCESLVCQEANALCYRIDAVITDDDEVQRRSGYGALIHSLNVRPLEIWQRQEA
jgi:hypothetical protein